MTLVVWVAVLGLLAGGCVGDGAAPAGVSPDAGCDELADAVAELAVDLADHAASSEAGVPPATLEATDPDQVDVWEVAAGLAAGSPELEDRVRAVVSAQREAGCEEGWAHSSVERRVQQEVDARSESLNEESFDREEYSALNLLAVLSANLAPPPERFDVPGGFPSEFPVHPDALLASSEHGDDGSVSATWIVEDGAFEGVSEHYSERFQEIRFGGWSVSGSSRSGGRHHLDVEGYGFVGEVTIEAGDDPSRATVRATLDQRE